jgi:AcrR family transcriptional regulator
VATDAGLSVATIYNRFPDGRDGLLAAAFDRSLDRVVGASVETLTVENLLDNGLNSTMCTLVEELADIFADEALVMRVALARLPESRLLRETYRRHEEIARQANRRFIELGQIANQISDGDPDELADLLIVLGQGINNPLVLGAKDRGQLCDRLAAAMVSALSPTVLEV